jgi:hypothetical protein
MSKVWLGVLVVAGMSISIPGFGQGKAVRTERRPAVDTPAKSTKSQAKSGPDNPVGSGSVYILDGLPISLQLHHDTEAGTNKPIDVYQFVIEMQVMNSDGNLEPEGLQIFNFYTALPQDWRHDGNTHDARDCKLWYNLQQKAMKNRDPQSKTWPYVEFVTSADARVVQTNEDGAVWYADDIECWGSSDRFPPF